MRFIPKPYLLKLHFTNKYVYAQVLRKSDGNIVASASTIERNSKETLPVESDRANKVGCKLVGQLIAERTLRNDISAVHFERETGNKYHGKLKVVLDTLRDAGLKLN